MHAKLAALLVVVAACGDGSSYEDGEELTGGETTVFDEGLNAFSLAARNLSGARRDKFFVGNSIFKRNWVTAPASTDGLDGLGPTFNASACAACHFKDGRGAPPVGDEEFLALLVRLSVPGTDEHGGPLGEPIYGGQFNHHAILGVPAEGTSAVRYDEVPGTYADGTPFSLRAPRYELANLAFGAFAPGTMMSPRVAPQMIGLGLLEALDEATVLALADEADADGDGISGRANFVWDPKTSSVKLGRFGWKANVPGIEQQTSGAFLGDMGITSPLFPDESCPSAQAACASALTGGKPEIDQAKIDQVTYYSLLLGVPVRRAPKDSVVLHGKSLFADAGCLGCHATKLVTGQLADFPEVSGQTIHPYTDLLLHDMGDELADNRPDFLATGTEWRTPPLWGLGLVPVVNGHSFLLHDGRARNFAEAILWHGGEAAASRDAFRKMDRDDRAALIRFLESL